jgi:hypothetical protein
VVFRTHSKNQESFRQIAWHSVLPCCASFFVAQCEPDPNSDFPRCDLAVRTIERATQKEELLARIVREMTENENVLETGTE